MNGIGYPVLFGIAPPSSTRERRLHGNEGPNWKRTPARMAQRAAARARALEVIQAKNAERTGRVRAAVLRELECGNLTTPALAARLGMKTKVLRDGHLAPMSAAGLISSREVPSPHGGPPTLEWSSAHG